MPKRIDTATRFWSKVDRSGGPDACWLWAAANGKGYGHFWTGEMNPTGTPQTIIASRWAYQERFGPIPEGLFACHKCDNPPCVNPDHIFLGGAAENAADMSAKGRSRARSGDQHGLRLNPERAARGEQSGGHKLTEAEVLEIRRRHAAGGVSNRQLAHEFGVTPSNLGFIVNRVTWRHV